MDKSLINKLLQPKSNEYATNFVFIGHLDNIRDVHMDNNNVWYITITPNSYKFLEHFSSYKYKRYKTKIVLGTNTQFFSNQNRQDLQKYLFNYYKDLIFVIRPSFFKTVYGIHVIGRPHNVLVIGTFRNNDKHELYTPIPICNKNDVKGYQALLTLKNVPWPKGPVISHRSPDGLFVKSDNKYYLFTGIKGQSLRIHHNKTGYYETVAYDLSHNAPSNIYSTQEFTNISYVFKDIAFVKCNQNSSLLRDSLNSPFNSRINSIHFNSSSNYNEGFYLTDMIGNTTSDIHFNNPIFNVTTNNIDKLENGVEQNNNVTKYQNSDIHHQTTNKSSFTVTMSGTNKYGLPENLSFSDVDAPININNINDFSAVTFKEDHLLKLKFIVNNTDAQHHWQLFIPGIDDYHKQINGLQINPNYENKINDYLHGKSCKYYLSEGNYSLVDPRAEYKRGKVENKFLSPNVYTVEVTDGKHWYYSHFVISAKELSLQEWSDMLNEIGKLSARLNIQYIGWQEGFTHKKKYGISRDFADELVKLSPDLIKSLHFILDRFRFSTAKKYRWVNIGKEHEIDAKTIRKLNETDINSNMIYSPYRYTNYDIGDNRWVKYLSIRLRQYTMSSIKFYKQLTNSVSAHVNLHNSQHKLEMRTLHFNLHKLLKLRNYINYALNASVLNDVKNNRPKLVSKGLIYSARYNKYYRLYIQLKKVYENRLVIHANQYRYKNTDKLYEFWIFIKIVRILISHKYRPYKGWGCGINPNTWLLYPNTRILLKGFNNNYLRVVYDDQVSNYADKYDEPISFIGTTHCRPDIRIDIFHGSEKYWGSIILDAKYKKLRNVINEGVNKGQLSDYYSKALDKYNNMSRMIIPNVYCVPKVIAVYPGSSNHKVNMRNNEENKERLEAIKHLGIVTKILRPDDTDSLSKLNNYVWGLINQRFKIMENLSK